jgi:1-acyl-sn-glycerol-3-phosphate acyltransferase
MVWAFARYFRGMLRRGFASVRWTSTRDPAGWDREVPTLFVSNHTSWWDGFLSYVLTQELSLTFHILMEAVNLDRYPAFRRIGTLPLRRDSLVGSYEDLEAARSSLRPGVGFWVYPQGQRRPAAEAISPLERGAAHLAIRHAGPLRICPVAFRYPFMSEQLPEALALVGEPWMHDGGVDRGEVTARMGDALATTVTALDARIELEDLSGFRILVPGRLSINKRMDRLRHSLGLLPGDFEERNG